MLVDYCFCQLLIYFPFVLRRLIFPVLFFIARESCWNNECKENGEIRQRCICFLLNTDDFPLSRLYMPKWLMILSETPSQCKVNPSFFYLPFIISCHERPLGILFIIVCLFNIMFIFIYCLNDIDLYIVEKNNFLLSLSM